AGLRNQRRERCEVTLIAAERGNPLQFDPGFRILSGRHKYAAEIRQSRDEIGVGFENLVEAGYGFLILMVQVVGDGDVGLNDGREGIEALRLCEFGERLVEAP